MNKNLLATILIVIAAGLYFTLTKPVIDDARAIKAQNDQYTAALGSAGEIIKARESVTREYNSISQENRDRLDKMIPSAVDNIRLVIDLNNLALRNRFSLIDVKAVVPSSNQSPGQSARNAPPSSPAAALSEPVLDKVQVTFSAVTTYDQFISFLRDLEANLRIMDLSHLSVATADNGLYSFQAQFQTYWLRQ